MEVENSKTSRCISGGCRHWLILLTVLLGLGASPVSAQIDQSMNMTVWKMLYGVTDAQASSTAWLAADDDGDGVSNGAELAAGTNPFSAASRPAVSGTALTASTVTLSMPTVPGKLYVVQSNADLTNSAGWTPVSPPVQATGDGTTKALAVPRSAGKMFYRVVIQDLDTDGDGVSDWAEDAVGLDPTTAHTNGAALDDHSTLAADLAGENVVTVTATKTTSTEPPNAATAATDFGTITITRGGSLHFSTLTVPLTWTGTAVSGTDYSPMPTSVTFAPKVGVITLTLTPLPNPALRTTAVATAYIPAGSLYKVGASGSASIAVAPAGNANGTGLTGYYFDDTTYKSSIGTYSPNLFLTTNLKLTRLDPMVSFTWTTTGPGSPFPMAATYYTVRWAGQVQPLYSETYYFDTATDDGVKLWVNGQLVIDGWAANGSADRLGAITLQAGVLYDIKMEYYQAMGAATASLSWYSNSQVKQIIPTACLYPATTTDAPPTIVSSPNAIGFVGQPFSFTVAATATLTTGAAYAVGNQGGTLPPGLALNANTGVISGTPTTAGTYVVALNASNAYGTGASLLTIQILPAGTGITRELWNSLGGSGVADIPLTTAPSSIDASLTTLEDNTIYAADTGERLRGYFVPPVTGNYYFWLASNNAAEFWISDNDQSVNNIRRAFVTAPGTASESWSGNVGQAHQRSPWLSMVAGQRYYYEVLHNSGTSKPGQNLAVGWLLDATGQATAPTANGTPTGGVVSGYVLTPYDYPATAASDGSTLYATNLSPQGASVSSATGSANLRAAPGNTQAILHFNYTGLSSPRTAYHIHIAPDSTGSGPIVFDLDEVDKFHPELKTADGGYIWNIVAAGAYSASDIVTALQQGRLYFNIHTVNFPNGEIRGFLTLVNGSQTAPVPVVDPGYANDSATDAGAARFLNQAAFGAAPADMSYVQANGYAAWINNQLTLAAMPTLPILQYRVALSASTNLSGDYSNNAWWQVAITDPAQLRQRVAFALSEILVVSDTNSTIANNPQTLASYYDLLTTNAFGNFRDLLEAATLHPGMGYWLNMQGNAQGNLQTGYHPNENYGREIMQLFSVGLNRLWPDGSLVLDSQGNLVPTYTQSTITNGFARVFTGWTWNQVLQGNGQLPTSFYPKVDWIDPMVMVKGYHELGLKTLLDNVALPPAVGYSMTASPLAGSQADTTTAAYDSYCLGNLESALDNIFYHPNVGPYVCRQLIQRLVASNPSPGYVQRVVTVFNDDGTTSHVRGNMAAVVRAILLDGEARNLSVATASVGAGKQREPILRITGPGRTFLSTSNSGTYNQSGAAATTITTTNPHRFSAGDMVWLDFSGNDTGTPPVAPANNPTTGNYKILSTPAPTTTTFAVNALGENDVTFSQAAGSTVLTVNSAGPAAGGKVYLKFTSATGGTEADGIYTVTTNPTVSSFTVTATAPSGAVSGVVMVPKANGYDTIKNPTGSTVSTVSISTSANLNLVAGQGVWLEVATGRQLTSSQWTVASVTDERHFTVTATTQYNTESNQVLAGVYPLAAPVLSRSGKVALPSSEFNMGNTNNLLAQSPLDSPTVFNFFYPDYQYPGTMSAANLTTPEFQLTTASNIVTLTNTVNSTILTSGNANGLSSFSNGAINLDLSAYMGSPYVSVSTTTTTTGTVVKAVTTTTINTTALVNKLGDLLTGGTMSTDTKNTILAWVNNTTNFPNTQTTSGTTTNPPVVPTVTTDARDTVRAVVQMILASPEYAVQE